MHVYQNSATDVICILCNSLWNMLLQYHCGKFTQSVACVVDDINSLFAREHSFFLSLSNVFVQKKHWSIVFNKHCSLSKCTVARPAQLYGVCSQIVQRSQTNTHSIYIRNDIHMSIYIRLVRSVIKFFFFLEQNLGLCNKSHLVDQPNDWIQSTRCSSHTHMQCPIWMQTIRIK